MVSRRTVLALVEEGCDYPEIARRLRISPGLAHLVATGVPVDGGDTVTEQQRTRPGFGGPDRQSLIHPSVHNPTRRPEVDEWIRRRALADAPMRAAAAAKQH